jgi:hypothetical protein
MSDTLPGKQTANGLRLYHFAYLALLLTAGGVCQTFYWLLWPYKVMTINSLVVQPATLHAGDELLYNMAYCKMPRYEDARAEVQYSLIALTDSNGGGGLQFNLLGTTKAPLAAGCHQVTEGLIVPTVAPGMYELFMTRKYEVNPIRNVEISMLSAPFVIDSEPALIDPGFRKLLESYEKLLQADAKLLALNNRLTADNSKLLSALNELLHHPAK